MNDNKMPSHWKLISLGDFCSIQNGFPFKSAYFSTEEGIPLIRVRSLKAQNCDIYFKGEYEKSFLVNNEDILIGMDGDFQPCCWKGGKALLNQRVCKLVDFDERLDCDFAFHAIMKPLEKIQKNTFYTTVKHISSSKILEIEIPLPPLPEQRAIARVLRTVQAAREARLREIALERERKAALMEHLFTHGTRGEPTKRTEIGEMPESWEVVKFGKVIISSAFGPRFSSNYYDPDGSVATLRTTDLDNEGNINYSTMPLAKLELDGFKQHLLKSNDFLITRSGTCGIAAIFEAFEKPVLPGAFIIRFRLSNEINPLFLKYYVNSQQGRNRILQLAGGAVQKNLSGTSLRTFQIPLPLLVDQDAIVRSLIACDSKIAALDHEAHLHDKLFRAMLEELMTGRLRVGALATPSS